MLVQKEKRPSGSEVYVTVRCDVLMVAGFRIPHSDRETKSDRLAELAFGPISIEFRRHQWRLRAFALVQQSPLNAPEYFGHSSATQETQLPLSIDRCCGPRYGGPGRTGEGGWACRSVRCWEAASALCRRTTAMASG
jgi:hypothetical protein